MFTKHFLLICMDLKFYNEPKPIICEQFTKLKADKLLNTTTDICTSNLINDLIYVQYGQFMQ